MPDEIPVRPLREGTSPEAEQAVTDDLIKQVTDRVYDLLLHDLMIDRERHLPPSGMTGGLGGYRDRGGW